jgi:hypothetical protein
MSSLLQPQLLEALLAGDRQLTAQQAAGYAALVVLRHCAAALLHHGITAAHLLLKDMAAAQTPKAAPACQQVQPALAAAQQQVAAGRLEDHPKLRRLQQLLASLGAMYPVCLACSDNCMCRHWPLGAC